MPWSPNGADISDKKKAQMLLTFLNTYKDDLVGGTNKKFVTDLLKFIVSIKGNNCLCRLLYIEYRTTAQRC